MRKMVLTGLAVASLLTWQANGVAAQTAQGGQAGTTGQSGATAGQQAKKAGKAAAKAGQKTGDHAFVMEAAAGGLMEVELGRMAANQAENDQVKQFGQRMVDEHSKANTELESLAAQKNITLPKELDRKGQAARDHLAKLKGAEFDRAYMQHMVADHGKDVAAFQRESKTGTDPDVKAWAAKTLPTLQEHLNMAKQTASTVGASHGAAKKSGKSEKK